MAKNHWNPPVACLQSDLNPFLGEREYNSLSKTIKPLVFLRMMRPNSDHSDGGFVGEKYGFWEMDYHHHFILHMLLGGHQTSENFSPCCHELDTN